MAPARFEGEARLLEAGHGRVVVLGHDRDVALRRSHRLFGEQQVHLRPRPLDPRRDVEQPVRRVDALKAQQRPERDLGVDVGRPGLDRHVVDHGAPIRWRFASWMRFCSASRRASGSFSSCR